MDPHTSSCTLLTYRVRTVRILNSLTIEKETNRRATLSAALAESIHELLQLSTALDLEEDLGGIVGDFDVKVFGGLGCVVSGGWCACV